MSDVFIFTKFRIWVACLPLLLSGCSSGLGALTGPRQELPVPLEITIMAAENANPAINGRPSPVIVTLFELSATSNFLSTDFFSLHSPGGASLANELVGMEQHSLLPGEIRVVHRKAGLRSRFLGATAGFRDLENSVWRTSIPLPAPYLSGRIITKGSSPTKRLYVVVTDKSIVIRDKLEGLE